LGAARCANANARKDGPLRGRKPYGARPGEAEVIARMKDLRAQDYSVTKIVEVVNRDERPRTGKQFHPANIARILKAAGAGSGGRPTV